MTLSPYTSPLTLPTQRSPFINRSSYIEEESSSALQVASQLQRHSMYETSSLQNFAMQSSTFQQNTIPSTQALHLQPLGGRADLTAQPDQDDPSSPDSVSSLDPLSSEPIIYTYDDINQLFYLNCTFLFSGRIYRARFGTQEGTERF